MGFLTDHQHTAITDLVFRAISDDSTSLEIELPTLIDLIDNYREANDYTYTLNQEEAARAIRKRLKYGQVEQQKRALALLDLIIVQELRYSAMFNDEKLLKLLEAMAVNESSYGFDLEVVRITLRLSLIHI